MPKTATPHEVDSSHCGGCTCTFMCKCGAQKMVYNHEHGIWLNIDQDNDDYYLAQYESHSPSNCKKMEWADII